MLQFSQPIASLRLPIRSLIFRLLSRRVGTLSLETRSQLPQLESLGEALLDFSAPDDLLEWLQMLDA